MKTDGGKSAFLPEIFPLLPRIDNFLPCQRLLKRLRRTANFAKDVLVMLSFDSSKRLADEMLLYIMDYARNCCDTNELLQNCPEQGKVPSPISGMVR